MAKRENPQPKAGEETQRQRPKSTQGQPWRPLQLVIYGGGSDAAKPKPGDFATYEKMSCNPTIALARIIATAPCRAAKWMVEADDEADEEAVEFVEALTKRLWPEWISWACRALEFGFQSWEIVWDNAEGGAWQPKRLKPLSPKLTEILVDEEHGNFAGLKQDTLTLPLEKCLLYTYNPDPGNLYGKSRHENCRETAWTEWNVLCERLRKYTKRVAGAVPRIGYPEGETTDVSGAKRPNFDIACQVIAALEQGNAIAYPNLLTASNAMDLIRAGAKDLAGLSLWQFDFLESKDAHGAEFKELMTYCDQLMMRAWLVPERAALEAQSAGSRADSESHGDIAALVGELVLEDMLSAWNAQLVARALELNFGKATKDTIRVARVPLTEAQKAFYQQFVQQVFQQPANIDLLLKAVDLEQVLKDAGVPTKDEAADLSPEDVVPDQGKETPEPAMSLARETYRRMSGRPKATKGA